MARSKVFVLNAFHPDAIKLLQESDVEVVLPEEDAPSWHEHADGILIRSETRLTGHDFAMAKKLKVIVKQGSGVDNIDLDAAKKHGVAVCNTAAINSEAVAELTLTLALCVARRVVQMDRMLLRGKKLVRANLMAQSLHGKTIGVVGMGNVGRAIASKWIGAMEGNIIAYDPFVPNGAWDDIHHRRVVDLDELLRCSDVITLHVPLTDVTRDLIGKREFGLMRPNAILINCARGGIVDEEALLDALEAEKIFGAALDAPTVEPPTVKAYNQLLAVDNCIITPHVGATTEANQAASGKMAVQTLLAVLNGERVHNRLV
jgi:D-3-phosphoglycerate dehydrogenase